MYLLGIKEIIIIITKEIITSLQYNLNLFFFIKQRHLNVINSGAVIYCLQLLT